MADDIVTRLRNAASYPASLRGTPLALVAMEAADEIERLRALIAEFHDAWNDGGVDAVRDGRIHGVVTRRIEATDALHREARRG